MFRLPSLIFCRSFFFSEICGKMECGIMVRGVVRVGGMCYFRSGAVGIMPLAPYHDINFIEYENGISEMP